MGLIEGTAGRAEMRETERTNRLTAAGQDERKMRTGIREGEQGLAQRAGQMRIGKGRDRRSGGGGGRGRRGRGRHGKRSNSKYEALS